MNPTPLQALAHAAGVAIEWTDVFGDLRQVADDSLRAILKGLELPAGNDQQCRSSLDGLRAQMRPRSLPPLLTAWVGQNIRLKVQGLEQGTAYSLMLERGTILQGSLGLGKDGALTLPAIAEPGYHRLEVKGMQATLAVAPPRCFGVADALRRAGRPGRERPWGLAAQLYSLRRAQDGGLGDFTALESLVQAAAAQGASALAISPVHAMFSADPSRFSPYGPSSRLFFNVLHVDPARVLGADALHQALREQLELPGSQSNFAHLDASERVDWPAVAAQRLALLRKLFYRLRQDHGQSANFTAFCQRGSQPLQDHARFEALDAWFREQRPGAPQGDWRQWPESYRDPRGAAVETFARDHEEEIAFHQFLQWQADAGRQNAQSAAREAGMSIGIIADLAVGADPGGSQAWGWQQAMLTGLTVGAPPDLLSTQGQGWGLGAFSPRALQDLGFAPWLAMLRANMQHSGGVRIDHVLGLKRLWLVPDGATAAAGAYLHYPLEDLLRLTALESARHSTIVIGEDLGTVPEGFSEQLAEVGVLGIRVLWFQREPEGQAFLAPHEWPADAMATTSTHDLPTVAGWWAGQDITWRERLNLLGTEDPAQHRAARETDRSALWSALQQAGCAGRAVQPSDLPLEEVLAFTGTTPAALVLAPLEDVLGIIEQPNLPGTVAVHPNWQQRLPLAAGEMLGQPAVRQRLAALARARMGEVQTAEAAPPTLTAKGHG